MIGHTLDRYRILEKIGAGGMGEVYRARDERLQRDVALKVLPPGTLNSPELRQRFRQEALTLSRLNHPHVAIVHDFDTHEGVDYLVMEFVPGVALSDRLAQGALPEKEIIKLSTQVALALGEAHEQGVVHRDLKPGNIMVTPKGLVKVLDFGLAKLVRRDIEISGEVTSDISERNVAGGTLPYMSPEQLSGEPTDARTDIYSFGAVLYELMTGQRPFRETVAAKMIDVILHQSPVPPRTVNPRISLELERIALKCLEKEPGNRYQSAVDLTVDLRRLESSASALSIPHVPVRRSPWRRAAEWAAPVVIVLLIAAVALNLAGLRDRIFPPASDRVEWVAVLPVTTPAGNPEQEYFADGMTDALIAELANISALQVISRTSVMRYKGSTKSVPEIARELKVHAVLEASALESGGRVRITARLIRASSDTNIWSNSYERDLRDVLDLQREVASAVAHEIRVAVTPREAARLARTSPVNPEAYVAYIKGRYYLNKRTREDLFKAIEKFQLSFAKDPSYAPAYVGLSDAYIVAGGGAYIPPERTHPLAEAAAMKALELDDSSAEAHVSLATVRFMHYEWRESEQEFRRALALNPNYATAHHWYALQLAALGRSAESIAHALRAQELDPLSMVITTNTGWCYFLARQYDHTLEQARRTLDLDPNFDSAYGYLGQAFVEKGMAKEAIAAFQKAHEIAGGTGYLPELAYAHAVFGQKKEALRLLAEFQQSSGREPVSAYDVAMVYASLGDIEKALSWLEKSYQNREARLVNLKAHPRFDSLHDQPRFLDLLRRIGLGP
ncbi:MAG: protein kinase [Acidobacteria bacterium]|nr:protein kinase [Acidobacteriota bacterium]MCL5286777.1 protein kinase [Acidobacteriota bacterium]